MDTPTIIAFVGPCRQTLPLFGATVLFLTIDAIAASTG
jgi:hypothetical protein